MPEGTKRLEQSIALRAYAPGPPSGSENDCAAHGRN